MLQECLVYNTYTLIFVGCCSLASKKAECIQTFMAYAVKNLLTLKYYSLVHCCV